MTVSDDHYRTNTSLAGSSGGRSKIRFVEPQPAAVLRYDVFSSRVGELLLVSNGEALTAIHLDAGRWKEVIGDTWRRDAAGLAEVSEQLRAYFAGELVAFDLTVAVAGTVFQRAVWRALGEIAYGETASYRDIAIAVGRPRAMRAVGGANHVNPVPIVVPCHRVVGADGSLTGYGGGLEMKLALLQLERPLQDAADLQARSLVALRSTP